MLRKEEVLILERINQKEFNVYNVMAVTSFSKNKCKDFLKLLCVRGILKEIFMADKGKPNMYCFIENRENILKEYAPQVCEVFT